MDKLNIIIEQLVAEKSLSFEVLDQLKKIKEESSGVLFENKKLKDEAKINNEIIEERNNRLIEANSKLDGWIKRESDLIAREKAVLDIEHKLELAQLSSSASSNTLNEIKNIVGLVFKNVTVRENIVNSESVSTPQGYSNTTNSMNKTIEKE